nr:MAG: structural polyprotein [Skomarfal virus 12]
MFGITQIVFRMWLESISNRVVLEPQSSKDYAASKFAKHEKHNKQAKKESLKRQLQRLYKDKTRPNYYASRDKTSHNDKYKTCYPHSNDISDVSSSSNSTDTPIRDNRSLPSDNLSEFLECMRCMHNNSISDHLVSKIEDTVALFLALKSTNSKIGFVSILVLYFKTHFSKSISKLCINQVSALFDTTDDASSTEEYSIMPHSDDDKPDWLLQFKAVCNDWKLVANNQAWKSLSTLMSMVVSAGLCDASSFCFTLGGLQLFKLNVAAKQTSAIDLVDCLMVTVTHFVEGGYECFRSGSLRPLLYSDSDAMAIEDEFALCRTMYTAFAVGNLESQFKITENDFSQRLDKLFDRISAYVRLVREPMAKNLLLAKRLAIDKLRSDYIQRRVDGGMRAAPFAFFIYGATSVGKSSLVNLFTTATLRANGFDASRERIVTIKGTDKFDSTMRNNTNAVIYDDVCNTKRDFVTESPLNRIIEIVNNIPTYANMADVEQKGKVTVKCKVFCVTSNTSELDAIGYSNEPCSILRRMNVRITAKVRPQFCMENTHMLDADKARAYYLDKGLPGIPDVPDLWLLTLEKCVPIFKQKDCASQASWVPVQYLGKDMIDVDVFTATKYLIDASRRHYVNQEELLHNVGDYNKNLILCGECKAPSDFCTCHPEPRDSFKYEQVVTPHFGAELLAFAAAKAVVPTFGIDRLASRVESTALGFLRRKVSYFEKSFYFKWTTWIPEVVVEHPWVRNLILCDNQEILKRQAIFTLVAWCGTNTGISGVIYNYANPMFVPIYLLTSFLILYLNIGIVVERLKRNVYQKVAYERNLLPDAFKRVRDDQLRWVTTTCVALGLIYTAVKTYQYLRKNKLIEQGLMNPTCNEDVARRDSMENAWIKVKAQPIPKSCELKGMTDDHVHVIIQKNLAVMAIDVANGMTRSTNIFILQTNFFLMPKHVWKNDLPMNVTATILTGDASVLGNIRRIKFSQQHAYHIPGTDLMVVYSPSLGSFRNMLKFLPETKITGSHAGHFFVREKTGDVKSCLSQFSFMETGTTVAKYYGCEYNLGFPTYAGMCMAPIVDAGASKILMAFHLGGATGETFGSAGTVTRSVVQDAIKRVLARPGTLLCQSAGDFKTDMYGTDIGYRSEVHHKSPVKHLSADETPAPAITVYGSINGRSTVTSSVVESYISPTITSICGVSQIYGGPKFSLGAKIWRKCLLDVIQPSLGVDADALEWSVIDYELPLLSRIGLKMWQDEIRPLNNLETICGIDGKAFIDAMKSDTSIGFPLTGPKAAYMQDLDPDEYDTHACPKELDQRFWDEANRMENEYVNDRRCYIIFKACLKDEVVKISKEKVRVFNSCPVAAQLLFRKYYLPILRFLSMNPLLSEIAVGVNPHGPDWHELMTHVTQYGEERTLAGDYAAYDKKAPAQLMLAAFCVLIDLAKRCNYSERDISVMRGLATDTVYSMNAMNGDLVEFFGSNPSGNNLTVYLNCLMNSLWFRSGYHSIFKGTKKLIPFRSVCSLTTYGDDAISTVKKGYEEFNHISFAQYLAKHDMTFTMPNKTDDPTTYMNFCDADFLKRKNVYNEDLGQCVGILDEASIFKSLHCNIASKYLSPQTLAATNIDGALREWFYYGKETYERRQLEMQQVARETGISLLCKDISLPYDIRVSEWHVKYAPK